MSDVSMQNKLSRKKVACRIAGFCLIAGIIFWGLSSFFPYFDKESLGNASYGFYSEPDNTIETVFLGASTSSRGYIPTQLYEEYGISAYNLSSSAQPFLVSYYWLQEAYAHHPETLRNVVLDTATLRYMPLDGFYRSALDYMHFSPRKVKAYWEYSGGSISNMLSYICPLFSYHTRWEALTSEEFTKSDTVRNKITYWQRGWDLYTDHDYYEVHPLEELNVPDYYPDYSRVGSAQVPAEQEYYLEQIVAYCNEHGLHLTLSQTPYRDVSLEFHNYVQNIADAHGLTFLDFNYDPLYDATGINEAANYSDDHHLNYWGASKLTSYMGKYLTQACGATDVRGKEEYAFLDKELAEYQDKTLDYIAMLETDDPTSYLQHAMQHDNYTICISVKDEASEELTEEQRQAFAELGLTELSGIGYQEGYVAVLQGGHVLYEERLPDPNPQEFHPEEPGEAPKELTYSCELENVWYVLRSGGRNTGSVSEIVVDGQSYSCDHGISIVVYDNDQDAVINQAIFDTGRSPVRIGADYEAELEQYLAANPNVDELPEPLFKLYLYNVRCENVRTATLAESTTGDDDLLHYIESFTDNDRYAILISANAGEKSGEPFPDITGGLTAEVREELDRLGLHELSGIAYGGTYVGVLYHGDAIEELSANEGHVNLAGDLDGPDSMSYRLTAEWNHGNSQFTVGGNTYSSLEEGKDGIYVVIYDAEYDMLVSKRFFDTVNVWQVLPERSDAVAEARQQEQGW